MHFLREIKWRGILKRLVPVSVFAGILFYEIFYTNPPKSWQQAPEEQILIFFLPLLAFLTFLVNLFLDYLNRSFAIALGFFLVVFFQAMGILNIITLLIIVIADAALVKYIPDKSLTRVPKIPRLSRLGKRGA